MNKIKLPSTCRFKKIPKNETLYFQGNFVTNKQWLFRITWLLSLPRTRASGLIGLTNRVKRDRIARTIERLNGAESHSMRIEELVNSTKIAEYRPLDLSKTHFIEGYFRGRPDNYTQVVAAFRQDAAPILDIEYSAALFFSPEIKPMYRDEKSPVIALDQSGEIVLMIMPLRHTEFTAC
jgi:hypothetical protein